jgi:uncharacterized protein
MSRVVHFEIHAEDPERAAIFYRTVFDWDIQKWENDFGVDYSMIMTGPKEKPGINGGLVRRRGTAPTEGQPVNAYVCTMEVDDLDAMIAKATSAGATMALPRNEIPGVGAIAYMKDTEGNIFGMLQPVTPAK